MIESIQGYLPQQPLVDRSPLMSIITFADDHLQAILLAHQMRVGLFVFIANELDHLRI